MNNDDILDLVTEEIVAEWLLVQLEPGIYRILYDPDIEEVYTTSTFSGDNSYIPGDNRICLISTDIREYLSLEIVGLTEEGDIADGDTYQAVLWECECALEGE